ncbi:hypothetical protein SKAU_G00406320 [Synaphobranchus kaupii]|uniref:RUN domain-containing protein n=1 Tax=Synaphobranchus kaupii TaxID=118154 RepID=A0A9Q1IAV8_SYNKA|nr:hypothetical protein SKAU_G00406320 [Synaphobranchus kaupii]
MLSPAHPNVPPRPCQSTSHKQGGVEQKSPELGSWRDDINMNTTTNPTSSHQGYANNGPAESVRSRGVDQSRSAVDPQKDSNFSLQNHKPNIVHLVADPSSALDPNCNEPSLPCLCCNGYSPQDNNSTYNLNYINNNTVTFGQQPQQTQSSSDESYQEDAHQAQQNPKLTQLPDSVPSGEEVDKTEDEEEDARSRTEVFHEDYADDDDTLIPSCWDCPPSLLEFSLSSFTSSSSTSISGCSDLESDCPDAISLSCQDFPPEQSHSAPSLDDESHTSLLESYPPPQLPLPGGLPSVLSTPSSDSSEGERPLEEDDGLLDLQRLSESVEELGKAIHRQAAQLAQWDLEGYLELRDELDHLEGPGRMNAQRSSSGLGGLEQVSFGFGEADPGDVGSLFGGETSSRPLDCSDAAAESSTSSVFDGCVFPDSFLSSRLLPPTVPTMLRVRDMDTPAFTYMNMNASTPSPPTTSYTYSSSPSFSAASSSSSLPGCKAKAPAPSFAVPPSQPIPYFTFHSSAPSFTSLPPPIPPPRRKRQARLEALKKASEGTPASKWLPLPPPPPLPPAASPPCAVLRRKAPVLPPPPSFHALDDEIRKLLILAGVTQDELLKLGPELGVGVMELLEPEVGERSASTRPGEAERPKNRVGFRGGREGRQDGGEAWIQQDMCRERKREERWREVKDSGVNRELTKDRTVEGQVGKGGRETLRATSFTEMARRPRGNSGSGSSSPGSSHNCGSSCDAGFDSYYSITTSNAHSASLSFHNNNNNPSSTAAPPSRPLPPCPPALPQPPPLPRPNRSTVPANKFRPERFDWLIEFSPDTDTLSKPSAINRAEDSGAQKFTTGAKVTTFKELPRQSRQNPAPAVIHKEPDLTAITPEPDFLYSQKWTTESMDDDDHHWQYSAQAQTSVLQPPPITPLALLKEMLPTGRGEAMPHPFPLIGCSVCEHRLQAAVEDREEAEATMRGRADGGMTQDSSATVCSQSLAQAVQRGGALATDGVRAQLRGQGLFSPCMQEKRALLSPISIAVDAILAQFNSSRSLVQKVQSGDSRVNPSLGRLVLHCLCPALSGLLSDGLKPYQTDLITGRRPNSPWGLVQACTGPGPSTQAMYSLQCQVSQLPQLRQSRHRFSAFLLGLLNIKLLDHWVFHLQSCDDVLETHYHPTSFMGLSRTSCQPLFEELLLLLQPLSLLTFNLDLLFQHRHFDPTSPANYIRENAGPANQACSFSIKGLSCWRIGQSRSSSKQASGVLEDKQKTKLAALANNSTNGLNGKANGSPVLGRLSANKGEAANQILWKESEIVPTGAGYPSQQAGQAIQQGWESVVQWGGMLGQSSGSSNKAEQKAASMRQDSWPCNVSLEYDYINHEARRNRVPERNSAAPWVLGMLFGASRGQKDPRRCTTSARRPSHWLAPGVSVLSRIVSTAHNSEAEEKAAESEQEKERARVGAREHPRSLRAQRDHRPRGQLY